MKRRKLTVCGILTVFLVLLTAFTAFAGTWQRDGWGWWYQRDDGSYPKNVITTIDGERFAFDKYGYMFANAWVQADKWYYFTGNGTMARNTWIDGSFYVGDDGVMLTNAWTPDGYWVDSSGKWDPSKGGSGSSSGSSGIPTEYYTIDGNWDNRTQAGFSADRRVDMWIELNAGEEYMGTMNFGLYMSSGTPYSLYDRANPNGDELAIATADGLNWGARSTITNDWYEMTYDGKDTITLKWRNTSWTSGTLVFKRRSGGHKFQYWSGGGVG